MAFREKTKEQVLESGDKVKHWESCPIEDGFCTCDDRANAEYWRMDQISNCAYEATGRLKPKQLMYGIVDKFEYGNGKVEKFNYYCCSKWCADRYRKEML